MSCEMTGLAPGLNLTFKLATGRGCLGGLNLVLASVTVAHGLFGPGLLEIVAVWEEVHAVYENFGITICFGDGYL